MSQKRTNTKTTARKKNQEKQESAPKINPVVKPDDMDLVEWQRALRKQSAENEKLTVSAVDSKLCPGEYRVRNTQNRHEHKVVYRGEDSEWNYCSCWDFKTSQLGTCKHLEAVKLKVKRPKRSIPPYTSVYLSYSGERSVRIRIGAENQTEFNQLAKQYFDSNCCLLPSAYEHFATFLEQASRISDTFRCYDDALEFVIDCREALSRRQLIDGKYDDDAVDTLLNAKLYPYQREGIIFAAKAGSAIIADEMGLGKTIQAIGTAELLRREGFVGSVLVVCPTSLKYQWKREIERFTGCKVQVVEGIHTRRILQYQATAPYKIVSYNAACNDIKVSGLLNTDMVIMDEVQRLKNWDTQLARAARHIEARYRVLLSGTPLENKLEELYSIVELADQFCLGPYYKFRAKHICLNDNGKVIQYQNLNAISDRLKSTMIRRRKCDVALQLPSRMDHNLLVPMTAEQREIHDEFKNLVAQLVFKWQRLHFLSEHDRKRLMLFLSQMRMVCDSTFILDQKSHYDTKVAEVINIITNIIESGEEKVVVFSQWERMTRLVAHELEQRGIGFEYLHGGIPSKSRRGLVDNFTDNPNSRVFLSTDAGSTGLNLQVASTIINLDLPWNPAVLEQRVGRIYRIGQQRNIQVINLVSAQTIEEEMIGRLRFKTSLFEGALDGGEDSIFFDDDRFKGIMEVVTSMVEDEKEDSLAQETIESSTTEAIADSSKQKQSTTDVRVGKTDTQAGAITDTPEPIATQTIISTHTSSHLIAQGAQFFASLTQTLASPEATAQLVDDLVREDPSTGQTTLSIPVSSKKSVQQFLALLGNMLKQ